MAASREHSTYQGHFARNRCSMELDFEMPVPSSNVAGGDEEAQFCATSVPTYHSRIRLLQILTAFFDDAVSLDVHLRAYLSALTETGKGLSLRHFNLRNTVLAASVKCSPWPAKPFGYRPAFVACQTRNVSRSGRVESLSVESDMALPNPWQ